MAGSSSTVVKFGLDAGIIAGLEYLVNKTSIVEPSFRESAQYAAPFIGGAIAAGVRKLASYARYRELRGIEEDYLNIALNKRALPNLTPKECQKLDKEIEQRRQTLEKLRKDNLLIQ